ncbi:MAG TPA: ABC-2 transporter permease [Bacillota bacterium]|nr:ABC-2 transporter permease [Bacillota bacterium]HPE39090.1 ABC-2 transporter permease [Bacillota bacterium]
MIKNLLYKELRLATHPTQFLFLSFGLMLLIPAYPYYVAFFYITLSQFFVTTIGRENNDVSFTAMLPVAKRDVVKARLLMGVIFEVLSLIIAIPFSFLGTFTHPSGNEAGIEANPAFFGFVLIMFAIFNLIYYTGFYKTAYKAGKYFLAASILMFIYIGICESLVWIPVPGLKEYLDTMNASMMIKQLPILGAGILIFVLGYFLTFHISAKRFEKVDL